MAEVGSDGQTGQGLELPAFEMRPEAVGAFVTGSIDRLVRNVQMLKEMGRNPTISHVVKDERQKRNEAERAGIMATAVAFNDVAGRVDPERAEGWDGFIKRHVDARLAPPDEQGAPEE